MYKVLYGSMQKITVNLGVEQMRDEDIDSMSVAEFNRKYEGSFEELKAQSKMGVGFTGGNGSNMVHPSDHNISSNPAVPIPGKREIEKVEGEKRADREGNYFKDAFWVRKAEVLDPELMPITKLSDIVVKMRPQEVKGEVDHKHSYGNIIMEAARNLDKRERLEATASTAEEAEVVED